MRDKLAVASEVLADKIRWELRSREERDGADWTEDWEQEKVQKGIVFDEENTLMDHSKERVTNMPFCRRINILAPASKRNEIVIASMKQEIDAVTREFITEKCDSRGNQLDQGHDKETRPGLISLTSRVKSGEILVQQTDKSGKLAITTREEYVASLQPHIASDKVITLEEKNETEKILNGQQHPADLHPPGGRVSQDRVPGEAGCHKQVLQCPHPLRLAEGPQGGAAQGCAACASCMRSR